MQGYLWIIWVKLAGALWIIEGEIWQLINILFCGYRRLETTIRQSYPCRPVDLPQVSLEWVLIGYIQFIMRSVLNLKRSKLIS